MAPKTIADNKGQALLETLVSLPVVMAWVGGLFVAVYLIGSHYLIEHWTYQTSLCLAKEYPKHICEKEVRRRLNLLSFHRLKNVSLYQGAVLVRARLQMATPLHKNITKESLIRLPLAGP